MLELYTSGTTNGLRAAVMAEESGLPYQAHRLNLQAGDHKRPDYLKLNPSGRIPTLVDGDAPGGRLVLSQSVAIILYLAEKSGRLWPKEAAARARALEWAMFQATDLSPRYGMSFFLLNGAPEKQPTAVGYIQGQMRNFYRLYDQQLAANAYLAGADYTVADVVAYAPTALAGRIGLQLDEFANLKRWLAQVGERPAVKRGMAVMG
ncbi:MAG: glutathione S-transferase family protein [Alphaproteobacteria bacterium]|nr:glutathione S-transferase family protein [Alphaproteobacteria bacterium]